MTSARPQKQPRIWGLGAEFHHPDPGFGVWGQNSTIQTPKTASNLGFGDRFPPSRPRVWGLGTIFPHPDPQNTRMGSFGCFFIFFSTFCLKVLSRNPQKGLKRPFGAHVSGGFGVFGVFLGFFVLVPLCFCPQCCLPAGLRATWVPPQREFWGEKEAKWGWGGEGGDSTAISPLVGWILLENPRFSPKYLHKVTLFHFISTSVLASNRSGGSGRGGGRDLGEG